MKHVYHDRGFLKASIWPGLRHLREWSRNSRYRALHKFHRQVGGLPRRTSGKVTFEGRAIAFVDGPSLLSAWDEIFVNEIYDVGELDHVPCLVDVGANIGLAPLYWSWRYGSFEYLGFEPDPDIAACCRRNLEAWKINGRLEEAAAGLTEGMVRFSRDGTDSGRVDPDSGDATVRVVRASTLLPKHVDLLKIDVEGSELEVLRDLAPLLRGVERIFFEWHSIHGQAGLAEAMELVEQAGFVPYVQTVAGPVRPFHGVGTGEGFSQLLNVYCVRH